MNMLYLNRTFSILILKLILIFSITQNLTAQSLIQSGPMVGYSSMREVGLWIQTKSEAEVNIKFWSSKEPQKKFSTNTVKTEKNKAFTAKLIADNLEPGQIYNYEVYVNNKKISFNYELKFQTQKLWQWREDPPEFSFVTGSCFYVNEEQYDRPGKPYGSDYKIMLSIYNSKPDFMLWLGDNYYLREADWDSWSGILHRITHTRSLPELQPLLGSVHHYAIWDDHDFGPNNSNRGFWNKEKTLEAFKLFWVNPSYGIDGNKGITTFFEWADVDFFLMDDRYFRSPNELTDKNKPYLGDEQIQWLIDNLVTSNAPFKIIAIGGQVLNPVSGRGIETYEMFKKEKEMLLSLIEKNKIEGVIFLSGDRHHSEVSKLKRENSYPLYDITVSSLTAGVSPGKNENNPYRIGESIDQHNFAKITVRGPRKNRELECNFYDVDGKFIYQFRINENELKYQSEGK
ncbi:Alkaline phosphatase D [Ignavibacterium album JCM 16511]|uniref:Alkaline phosphatase D n=1 Tax=Ignavibacterium album (strain DSM 19864 / JCM 16511 / NBRC 101810 / Mat9-16) TaxID=945713 RepID=I0ALS9_IGNAJ|nr:alkaline phosphatase D family protein [Ignavibacterium album]AFH49936.1 Alkaline phosphatase D [Ignavibacterium album JCM 16511]